MTIAKTSTSPYLLSRSAASVCRSLPKSIFDPSPEGYQVAPCDAWMAASSTSDYIYDDGAWDGEMLGYGWTYNGEEIWFPTGGLINRKTGALQESGDKGYYWFNCPDSGNGAYINCKQFYHH